MPSSLSLRAAVFLSTPSARRATPTAWWPLLTGTYFYPRPPRGGRQYVNFIHIGGKKFLSTPSARRATCKCLDGKVFPQDFYPRPPRGGRLTVEEFMAFFYEFLSTPSARRATCSAPGMMRDILISIHALREEGDRTATRRSATRKISIHALREEGDHLLRSWRLAAANFYPRPPRGGRPGSVRGMAVNLKISIHALREEGDL